MLLKKYFPLIVFLFIYFILAVYFLPFYSNQINPDGISLINIAKEINNGQLDEAINAYWGILFSLLLSPFLLLPVSPLYAEKIMSILIGAFAIIGLYNLSLKVQLRSFILSSFLISTIPLVIYFSFSVTTADLLQLTILIFYLNIILSKEYFRKLSMGIMAGLLGVLSFLAKENGFFFFMIHFPLINSLYFLHFQGKENRVKLIKTFVAGLLTFLVLSSVWIGLLGLKYHKLMIGSRGSYNWALIGPRTNGHPRFYMGFLIPPTLNSISAWDDPTHPTPPSWSIFDSFKNLKFELTKVWDNLKILLSTFNAFSLIFIPLMSLLFLYISLQIFFLRILLPRNIAIITIFIAFITYTSAYLLTYLEERYLWIDFILLNLFGFVLLEKILSSFYSKRLPRFVINFTTLIVGIVFVLLISYKPINYLKTALNGDKFFFNQGNLLLTKYGIINANLASNDNWNWMLYYAFYTKGKYLGISGQNGDFQKLLTDIKKYNIDYYFVWNNDQLSDKLAIVFPELIAKDISGFRIFFIKG